MEKDVKILIITHYNFGDKPTGAINRVLGLAKVISKYALVKILHQGPNMFLENLQFISYKPLFLFNISHWISDAMSPYIGYTFSDFYKTVKKVINEVDIVQVEQPYLLIPTLMVVKVLNREIPIVLDEHNVDFMSVKSRLKNFNERVMYH